MKTEAKKRVTIGFGDYLVSEMKQDFDLSKQETLTAPSDQAAPGGEANQEAPNVPGGAEQQ